MQNTDPMLDDVQEEAPLPGQEVPAAAAAPLPPIQQPAAPQMAMATMGSLHPGAPMMPADVRDHGFHTNENAWMQHAVAAEPEPSATPDQPWPTEMPLKERAALIAAHGETIARQIAAGAAGQGASAPETPQDVATFTRRGLRAKTGIRAQHMEIAKQAGLTGDAKTASKILDTPVTYDATAGGQPTEQLYMSPDGNTAVSESNLPPGVALDPEKAGYKKIGDSGMAPTGAWTYTQTGRTVTGSQMLSDLHAAADAKSRKFISGLDPTALGRSILRPPAPKQPGYEPPAKVLPPKPIGNTGFVFNPQTGQNEDWRDKTGKGAGVRVQGGYAVTYDKDGNYVSAKPLAPDSYFPTEIIVGGKKQRVLVNRRDPNDVMRLGEAEPIHYQAPQRNVMEDSPGHFVPVTFDPMTGTITITKDMTPEQRRAIADKKATLVWETETVRVRGQPVNVPGKNGIDEPLKQRHAITTTFDAQGNPEMRTFYTPESIRELRDVGTDKLKAAQSMTDPASKKALEDEGAAINAEAQRREDLLKPQATAGSQGPQPTQAAPAAAPVAAPAPIAVRHDQTVASVLPDHPNKLVRVGDLIGLIKAGRATPEVVATLKRLKEAGARVTSGS